MTTESIIVQIKLQSHLGLSKVYEGVCEEYRKRLCSQWGISFNDSFWVADRIGEVLILGDVEFSFGMEDLRLIVDRNISYEKYFEYFQHFYHHEDTPINAYSWFVLGLRPKEK